MSYDNTCKYLAESSPASFVRWLLNMEPERVEVLKTELSSEPLRADSLVLLQVSAQILHLEFQTLPYSNPPVPVRMLEYKSRLLKEYPGYPLVQFVIFLKSTNSELVYENEYRDSSTVHRYRVIRLWEEDPAPLLEASELLPLAALAKSDDPNTLLRQVSQRVAMMEDVGLRQNIIASASILAGLRFEETFIRSVLREDLMKESVIYQSILREGIEQGIEQGRAKLLTLLQHQLTRRLGVLEPQLEERIARLSMTQLEELGEVLLDFSSVADLVSWLEARES
ncbi:MAG: Rpn family recombination-promoting nuclease/putative transposase [Oscillatoria princeps RMCB-10]|nr:Rpn family recombination-promoting nuclease/putative transposase [Oscillatoria princeps RMCB-10]